MRGQSLRAVRAGDDAMPGLEQALDDGAAQKSGGAGDQYGFPVRDGPSSPA
jgi:hypothetical protein